MGQKFHSLQKAVVAAIGERVEDPDLNRLVGIEGDDLLTAGQRVAVIDQDPDPHATIGGTQQRIRQQPASFVAAKYEVLQIQSPFCGVDHLHASLKSFEAERQDVKSR